MKMLRPSKTMIATLCLIVLGIVFVIFSYIRAAHERAASIPTLPNSDISQSGSEDSQLNAVDYSKVTITTDNVVQVIRELKRPQNYYYETESELFAEDSSAKYLRRTWKHGSWQRIDLLSSAEVTTMHIIYGNEKAFFWEPNARTYYTANIGDVSADDTQMMMAYEDILELSASEILSASFTTYENQGCIYVEAQPKSLGYQTSYWVSTESGLLLAGQAKKAESVFYTIKLTTLTIGEQEDVIFRLPNGNLAMNEV